MRSQHVGHVMRVHSGLEHFETQECVIQLRTHSGRISRSCFNNPRTFCVLQATGKTSLSLDVDFSKDTFPERDHINKYTLNTRFGRVIAETMTQQDLDLDEEYEHDAESKNTILRPSWVTMRMGRSGIKNIGWVSSRRFVTLWTRFIRSSNM